MVPMEVKGYREGWYTVELDGRNGSKCYREDLSLKGKDKYKLVDALEAFQNHVSHSSGMIHTLAYCTPVLE